MLCLPVYLSMVLVTSKQSLTPNGSLPQLQTQDLSFLRLDFLGLQRKRETTLCPFTGQSILL